MISSTIWDKSAQANFSKTNQIARAPRASAICGLWKTYDCCFSLNCTRKIMWLLVNNMSPRGVCQSSLFGQNFDKRILMDKNAAARNLFIENWSLLSFWRIFFNSSYFFTAPTEINTSTKKIPLLCRGGSRIFSNVPGPRNGGGGRVEMGEGDEGTISNGNWIEWCMTQSPVIE